MRSAGSWNLQKELQVAFLPSPPASANAANVVAGLEDGFERDGSCTRGQSLSAAASTTERPPLRSVALHRPSEPPRERRRRSWRSAGQNSRWISAESCRSCLRPSPLHVDSDQANDHREAGQDAQSDDGPKRDEVLPQLARWSERSGIRLVMPRAQGQNGDRG